MKTVKIQKEINYLYSEKDGGYSVIENADNKIIKVYYNTFFEASRRAKELVQKFEYILVA